MGFMKKKQKRQICAMCTCLCIIAAMFTGCATNQKTGDTREMEEQYTYVSEFYSPQDSIISATVLGDSVYFGTEDGQFYSWNLATGKEPERIQIPTFDESKYVSGMVHPDFDGNFYVIHEEWKDTIEETEEEYVELSDTYLSKYDAEGNELFRKCISKLVVGSNVQKIVVDSENHAYILANGAIFLFDTEGNFQEKVKLAEDESIQDMTVDANGNVYGIFIDYNESTYLNGIIRKVDYEKGLAEEEYRKYSADRGCAVYDDGVFLGDGLGKLYLYDVKTQTSQEILKWMNCEIENYEVEEYAVLSDGRIVVFLLNTLEDEFGEFAILTKTDKSEIPEKKIISLGTFNANEALWRMVARFNRQSNEYKIEVVEYYDPLLDEGIDDSAKELAYTRLHLDMVGDNCPDILNLEYNVLREYADKDLFEDLTPYMEGDESLEIMENVLDTYTFGGKLIAIPKSLAMQTIACESSVVDGKEQWTLEEMMKFSDGYAPEDMMETDAVGMLEKCMILQQSNFVDIEKNSCNFNSPEFCELLEFCYRFKDNKESSNTTIYAVLNGNEMLYEVEINSVTDITLLRQMFGTADISFVGYLTQQGESGCLLKEKGGSYAITTVSENKDGAWEFIQMLLKDAEKFSIRNMKSGFPTELNAREKFFESAMEEPYFENGERRYNISEGQLKYYVPLEDEIAPIRELLAGARMDKNDSADIMTIVLEEAELYFADEKTAEEVAELIQNRVTIYLDE